MQRITKVIAFTLASLLLLAGCGGSVPPQQPINGSLKIVLPRGDASGTGLFDTKPLHKLNELNGGLKWKTKPTNSMAPSGTGIPIPADGLVYIVYSYSTSKSNNVFEVLASARDSLAALDANTGEAKWSFAGDGTTSPPLVYAHGIIYFSTTSQFSGSDPSSTLYAVNATNGKEVWRFSRKDAKFGPMVVASEMIYFPSDEATSKLSFYALDLGTGKEKWTYGTKGLQSGSTPVVVGSMLYFSTQWLGLPDNSTLEATTYALDSNSGQEKWRRLSKDVAASGEGPLTGSQLNLDSVVNPRSITAANGVAYVLGEEALQAFDVRSKQAKWKLALKYGTPTAITLAGDMLYFGSVHSDRDVASAPEEIIVHAVNTSTGQEMWSYKVPTTGNRISALTIDDGVLYFSAGNDAYTYALYGQ